MNRKTLFKLNYDYDILQYILIDGMFSGAVVGKFKNGLYVIEDIMLDLHETEKVTRKDEIMETVYPVNGQLNPVKRHCGVNL